MIIKLQFCSHFPYLFYFSLSVSGIYMNNIVMIVHFFFFSFFFCIIVHHHFFFIILLLFIKSFSFIIFHLICVISNKKSFLNTSEIILILFIYIHYKSIFQIL